VSNIAGIPSALIGVVVNHSGACDASAKETIRIKGFAALAFALVLPLPVVQAKGDDFKSVVKLIEQFYGVKHLDRITMKVTSPGCNTRFDDMIVRVDPSFKLEVHIDTDEANACDLERATKVELFKT